MTNPPLLSSHAFASCDVLKNRIVFVTGAAGRLGRVASLACARQGATVVLADKNRSGIEKVYDEILTRGCPEPALYPIDFAGATEHDYEELARTLDREFGMLHGLLHSAAGFAPLGPISDIDIRDWTRVLNVNVNAPFLLTQALLGLLEKSEDGSIVFTSDSSARKAKAYWGIYGLSKIAVEGFAGILADELDSAGRVRVNILIPGPVDSPLRNRTFPGENPEVRIDAESMENLYIYLMSSASRGQNGQVFQAKDAIQAINTIE